MTTVDRGLVALPVESGVSERALLRPEAWQGRGEP